MTPKQRRLAEEYLIDLDRVAAYRRAGYKARSDATARQSASEILTNPDVAAYIAQLQQERSRRTGVTLDRVLDELAAIAFAKITDVLQWDSEGIRLKDSAELPASVLAAVAEISQNGSDIRVKMHSKMAALALAGKHVGLDSDLNQAIAVFRRYGYQVQQTETGYTLTDPDAVAGDALLAEHLEREFDLSRLTWDELRQWHDLMELAARSPATDRN